MSSTKEIEDIDYSMPKLGKLKWFFLIGVSTLLFLFLSFPIKQMIHSTLQSQLASIPGCPLTYKEIKFEFLLPKILVKDVNIPMSCFKRPGAPLKLKQIALNWRGFNFVPFGPHFKLKTNIFGNDIAAFYSLGLGSQVIKVQDLKFKLDSLKQIMPQLRLAGFLKVNSLIKFNSQGPQDIKLTIQSKNLNLPPQEVMKFKLPNLQINNFFVKANMIKPNELQINDFILGDTESPIRANFKGKIKLNQKFLKSSQLDLDGEVAFSQIFLEQFAIIKLFMNKFTKKDDFYQLHFDGPITAPNVVSPKNIK